MPKFSRSNSLLRSTDPIMPGTVSASRCRRATRGVGTTNSVMAMPASASTTISQKMPRTPMKVAAIGPATNATMKEAPMVMPTIAIALVRLSSVVRSATSARITEPTAPAALQHAADDDAADRGRQRGHRAAERRTG